MPTSPIACSYRPEPWSPTSAACCKRPASPPGNSCRQPVPLRTESHNLSLRLAVTLLQEFGYAQVGQRLGVARETDVPVPIRRRSRALRVADGNGEVASWQHQRHAVVVQALLKGIAGDAVLDQHRVVHLQQPILMAPPLGCVEVADKEAGQIGTGPGGCRQLPIENR